MIFHLRADSRWVRGGFQRATVILSMSMDFRSHCTLRCDRALNGFWIRLKAVVGFIAIIRVNTQTWYF